MNKKLISCVAMSAMMLFLCSGVNGFSQTSGIAETNAPIGIYTAQTVTDSRYAFSEESVVLQKQAGDTFKVLVMPDLQLEENDKDFKKKMANILNYKTFIDGKNTTLDLAIRQFTKSVFHALEEENENLLTFPEKITQDEL